MVPRVGLERTGLGVGVEVGALVGPGRGVGLVDGGRRPGGGVADKVAGVVLLTDDGHLNLTGS